MTNRLQATCLWRITPALVAALDAELGIPVDAYVNGSQVWLRDDEPTGCTLEWRLHPVADYRRPTSTGTYELFEVVAGCLATGAPTPAPLDQIWDGLEVFAAYGEELEPQPLAASATATLGLAPDACGLVDHGPISDEWERTGGKVSILADLFMQLGA